MYGELAAWWPLLDDPADYAEEAGVYGDLLVEVGFEARSVPLVLSDVEPGRHEMFACRRPATPRGTLLR